MANNLLNFFKRLFFNQRQEEDIDQKSQNLRLAMILKASKQRIWIFDMARRHYLYLSDSGKYEEVYNLVEFSRLFNRDDYEVLSQALVDVSEGKEESSVVRVRSNTPESERIYEINISVAGRDKRGNISSILGIQHDITNEVRKQHQVNQLLMRYHTVFNTSLLDMVFYDKNGVVLDINDKACQAFGIKDREQVLKDKFLLKNNPMYSGVDLQQMENTRSTTLVDFSEYQDAVYQLDRFGLKGKMYYDSTINPIRNAKGELEGAYMCGRDITEMVDSVHRQREGAERVRRATQHVQAYIDNINYALQVSGVRFVSYYPKTFTFELSDSINEARLRLSQLRCIRLGTPRFRRTISSALNRMDHLIRYNIKETIETEIRDEKGRQIWLMFNMVPILDKEGQVEHYFGICRNLTDMVETERRLAVETQKAQETELLKQSFLTNMSYEIRTPLNNVVGFADLFETEHDAADEAFFVEQIKTSSNTLLSLINDILFLSRLDANMIEYNKADIDFSMTFGSHCQMGWSNLPPAVNITIDCPYESLVVNLDEEHLGMAIERLCSLTIHFLDRGNVTARCEYRRGELTLTFEDDGIGIDEETLPHIYDRFARSKSQKLLGTGLDLPIVQSLVQQMGGTLDIESEKDKGITVWISIPCEAKVIKRRANLNNEL